MKAGIKRERERGAGEKERGKERQRSGEEKEVEGAKRENSNSKTLILKDSSVGFIWTCPERERERLGKAKGGQG